MPGCERSDAFFFNCIGEDDLWKNCRYDPPLSRLTVPLFIMDYSLWSNIEFEVVVRDDTRMPLSSVSCLLNGGHRAQHVSVGTGRLLSWFPSEAPPALAQEG